MDVDTDTASVKAPTVAQFAHVTSGSTSAHPHDANPHVSATNANGSSRYAAYAALGDMRAISQNGHSLVTHALNKGVQYGVAYKGASQHGSLSTSTKFPSAGSTLSPSSLS